MTIQPTSRPRPHDIAWGLLGAVAFAAPQIVLLLSTPEVPGGIDAPGWFLNSGRNALVVGAALAVGAAALSLRTRYSIQNSVAYGLGAIVAMVATSLSVGPGSIFPIVVALGTVVVTVVVVIGAACGAALRAAARLLRS